MCADSAPKTNQLAPALDSFPVIFERIQAATSTKTQVQLAEILGIRQSSISDAKRRESIPAEWYQTLLERGINSFWLKYGQEPVFLPAGGMAELPLSQETCSAAELETLLHAMVVRLAPEELIDEISRTLCLKFFTLTPTDTFVSVIFKILPGDLAKRLCDHVFTELFPIEEEQRQPIENDAIEIPEPDQTD